MEITKDLSPLNIKLEAIVEGKKVGSYLLNVDESGDISHGFINSKLNKAHVSRTLINEAATSIQVFCQKYGRDITHKCYLVSEESRKLCGIFEELGYSKEKYDSYLVLTKKYLTSVRN